MSMRRTAGVGTAARGVATPRRLCSLPKRGHDLIVVQAPEQEPERGPEEATELLPDGSMVPEDEYQLWTSDGRMIRMFTPEERLAIRTEPDGTAIRYMKEPGPWHPRWCQTQWCTAWSAGEPARHRSDPYVFHGAGHVLNSMFAEADGYGLELYIRLVGAGPPYRGNWWEPDDSRTDVALTLRAAERLRDALADQLEEVRAELSRWWSRDSRAKE